MFCVGGASTMVLGTGGPSLAFSFNFIGVNTLILFLSFLGESPISPSAKDSNSLSNISQTPDGAALDGKEVGVEELLPPSPLSALGVLNAAAASGGRLCISAGFMTVIEFC